MPHRTLLLAAFVLLVPNMLRVPLATACQEECTLTPIEGVPAERVWRGVLETQGVYAYMAGGSADSSGALSVVDLSPAAGIIGRVPGQWAPYSYGVRDLAVFSGPESTEVAMVGQFAGTAQCTDVGYLNCVVRYDVTDPNQPAGLDTTFVGCGLWSLAYDEEGELYCGTSGSFGGTGAFVAVDRNESVVVAETIEDIVISGGVAFLATLGTSGIQKRVDVVDLDSLEVIGSVDLLGLAVRRLDLGPNDVLYACGAPSGIAAIDVSDPTQPVLLGAAQCGSTVGQDVAVAGDRAYVANNIFNEKLEVYDISDPANIERVTLLGPDPVTGSGLAVAAHGNRAYLMTTIETQPGESGPGLLVLDSGDCYPVTSVPGERTPGARLRITPTVIAAGSARVSLETRGSGPPVELRVVDVTGRIRSRIELMPAGTGRWSTRWSATDEHGSRLPSGKYWVVGTDGAVPVVVLR